MESDTTVEMNKGRLAARVLIGFVVLYAAIYAVRLFMGVVPNLLMKQFGASPDFRAFAGSTLNYGVGIASYILFPAIVMRRVLGVEAWSRLFPLNKGWWKDVLCGLLLVGGVLLLFFAGEAWAGWLTVDGWNWNELSGLAFLRVAWVGLLVNVGVAIGEETVFRGYLLSGLKAAWGKWMGLLAMTVIFGLFHLPAYMGDQTGTAALTLAIVLASLFGLLFGLVYVRTGSLWLPIALHFAWNFVENDLLNLSADMTNTNLVGALTRLRSPLGTAGTGAVLVVVIETFAFCAIAIGVGLWLRGTYKSEAEAKIVHHAA